MFILEDYWVKKKKQWFKFTTKIIGQKWKYFKKCGEPRAPRTEFILIWSASMTFKNVDVHQWRANGGSTGGITITSTKQRNVVHFWN
jgi:hypothetical protein